MVTITEARKVVDEFKKIADENELSTSDLEKITAVMKEPSETALRLFLAIGAADKPTAQWMANTIYNAEYPKHGCYRNDKFCIAHYFGFNEVRKKESGLWIIENAMAGYFEPITHGGFRLNDLLCDLGALKYPVETKEWYVALSHDRIRVMAKALQIGDTALAHGAENVIRWCLREGYKVIDSDESTHGATFIPLDEARDLAMNYLPSEKFNELKPLFEKASRKTYNDSPEVRWGSIHPVTRL